MAFGQLRTDSAVYHTAAPSMKMTPNNASNKLELAPKDKGMLVAVASGDAVTASVWVRKDATYTGSQPRLIVRANAAIGINADTVLATATDLASIQTGSFDPATTTNVALSNGNLTATHTNTTSSSGARVVSYRTSGKYYFEILWTASHGATDCAGMLAANASYVDMAGGSAINGNVQILRGGSIYISGINTGVLLGSFAANDVMGMAVDFDARLIWARRNNGNWNNSGTANPVTGTGGVALTAGNSVFAFAPATAFSGAGTAINDAYTANFGATTYANAAPSGFINWPTATPNGTATWVQLSGTTPSATDDGAVELIVDCDGSGFINVDDWAAS